MNKNLSSVIEIYEAFKTGNIPALLDHLADDISWEHWKDNTAQKAGVPWMQFKKGKAGAAEFFALVGTNLQITEFNVLSIMANEHQVAAEFEIEALIKATGQNYRDEELHLWTFNEEGKVIRLRHYLDTAKHIKANEK